MPVVSSGVLVYGNTPTGSGGEVDPSASLPTVVETSTCNYGSGTSTTR